MAHTHRVSAAPAEELPADLLRLASAIRALPDEYSRELIPPWSAWWKARNAGGGF